ncbi:hypothetical protein CDIK_1421 [Cucumispora dikerogammari]|nr:hypothetical protein CDIK_1421 [Cucumispora dikerogammari]
MPFKSNTYTKEKHEEKHEEDMTLLNQSAQLTNYAESILREATSQNNEIDRAQNLFKYTIKNVKEGVGFIEDFSEQDFSLFLYLGGGTCLYVGFLYYFFL